MSMQRQLWRIEQLPLILLHGVLLHITSPSSWLLFCGTIANKSSKDGSLSGLVKSSSAWFVPRSAGRPLVSLNIHLSETDVLRCDFKELVDSHEKIQGLPGRAVDPPEVMSSQLNNNKLRSIRSQAQCTKDKQSARLPRLLYSRTSLSILSGLHLRSSLRCYVCWS